MTQAIRKSDCKRPSGINKRIISPKEIEWARRRMATDATEVRLLVHIPHAGVDGSAIVADGATTYTGQVISGSRFTTIELLLARFLTQPYEELDEITV